MGSTCLDEWTMAVSGFAMSAGDLRRRWWSSFPGRAAAKPPGNVRFDRLADERCPARSLRATRQFDPRPSSVRCSRSAATIFCSAQWFRRCTRALITTTITSACRTSSWLPMRASRWMPMWTPDPTQAPPMSSPLGCKRRMALSRPSGTARLWPIWLHLPSSTPILMSGLHISKRSDTVSAARLAARPD